jgi:peptide-methionine (S)-S-oxide reductase
MKIFSMIALFGLLILSGCSDSAAWGVQTQDKQTENKQATESQETTGEATAKEDQNMNLETATFAGGCFWCTEAVFLRLDGVESVMPGYMGGHVVNPTYEQVCGKKTGHAEVIQIKFDSEKISFDELLYVFFSTHDPTTLNRQGNDVGPQYRSAVFYHDDQQKESAESIIKTLDAGDAFPKPIVTEVTAAATMYDAENYHVDYFNNNPGNGYCRAVIPSKLMKLKKLFGDKLKSQFKN